MVGRADFSIAFEGGRGEGIGGASSLGVARRRAMPDDRERIF